MSAAGPDDPTRTAAAASAGPAAAATRSPPTPPKFVTGSTLRHVVTMTATGSIGLAAVFMVDVLNLFYIARLGQQQLAAAIGYAGTLLFFLNSLAIGLSIAAGALTSRALGRGDRARARTLAGASLLLMGLGLSLAALLLLPWLGALLRLLGASGETAELARRFMTMVLPSAPLLGLGMCLGALLRAVGDAKRAMFVTLGAGAFAALLDPLLILVLGWGLDGAALSQICARAVMVGLGAQALWRVHGLVARPDAQALRQSLRPFLAIAGPAVLTQIATPVANTFVTVAMAPFGDSAVAGWAVVGRIIPFAFVMLFALSGAVGPILGQNLGARRYERLHSALRDSLRLVLGYTLAVWLLLALGHGAIADAFAAQGEARGIIRFFCLFVAGSFVFSGALFVANAAFNNLGYALYSTALNWGRATLGVAPFIWLGARWWGAPGVIAGYGLGVVGFGVLGTWLCFRVVERMALRAPALAATAQPAG